MYSTVEKPSRQAAQKGTIHTRRVVSAVREAHAALLHTLLPIDLDEGGYARLKRHGLSRGEVQKATDVLIAQRLARIEHTYGYIRVVPQSSEAL